MPTTSRKSNSPPPGRILIVSNRLPFTVCHEAEGIRLKRSSGGLTTGLRHVHDHSPSLWIGWTGAAQQGEPLEGLRQRLSREGSIAIPLTDNEVHGFYHQYSNSVLWPALHSWNDVLRASNEDWTTYRVVNERFADTVMQHVQPGDSIWIHDYHLMLVPQLLRARGCTAPICFFLHTPFPDLFTFSGIRQNADLLEGLLGADLIGFHTQEYVQNFLSAVAITLPCHVRSDHIVTNDRRVQVCAEPMGIDFDAFSKLAEENEIVAEAVAIRGPSKATLFLGVDRLDYTKGILQRLLGFEGLLQQYPALKGWARFIQIAVPTREAVSAYRDLREHVEAVVARINREYGSAGWTPVDYLFGSVDRNTLVALYRAADVMVVTPLRDGLNLVAKEFVAARSDEDGVLVLSRYAGAAAELPDALLVSPQRIDQLTAAYREALLMTLSERRARMRRLRESVAGNDVFGWADRCLTRLHAQPEQGPAGRTQGGGGPPHAAVMTGSAR